MVLPAGFVEEEILNAPQQPMDVNLPEGFVQEGASYSEIRQAPPKGIMKKVISFFQDEDKRTARASNIYALSEVTGLPLNEVNKNYDALRRSSGVTGIKSEPTDREFLGGLMIPGVIAGAMVNPIGTAAGLITFGILDKSIPTDRLIEKMEEEGIADEAIQAVEVADFIGKAILTGGVLKKSKGVAEIFTKRKVVEYKLPETVSLTAEQVRDIYQTGELTTAEQKSLWAGLELNSFDRRAALEHGISINVPSERL